MFAEISPRKSFVAQDDNYDTDGQAAGEGGHSIRHECLYSPQSVDEAPWFKKLPQDDLEPSFGSAAEKKR